MSEILLSAPPGVRSSSDERPAGEASSDSPPAPAAGVPPAGVPSAGTALACVASATVLGARGLLVQVEVHVAAGLPSFTIVGLPDDACREARDRVRAAVLSSGLAWPLKRITVNLAPSGVRKVGAGLDLAIAVGVLAAGGAIDPADLVGRAFVGELGLDGAVRPVAGVVPIAAARSDAEWVVPASSVHEAEVATVAPVRAATTLGDVVGALRSGRWPTPVPVPSGPPSGPGPDLADVRGQETARMALEVAAAGAHHLLLVGPPGAGKTMLAARLPGLLPDLDRDAALEVTMLHSAAGVALPSGGLVVRPPMRAPHHNASMTALVGGGTAAMRPGEVSLAHHGVLFLDELGEFSAVALDGLRQPLEDGVVRVVRARAAVTFPARVLLVGAMNPCPCGEGGPPGSCACSLTERARYQRRLSGPLLDRFDLRLDVQRPSTDALLDDRRAEPSATVAERVAAARVRARDRGHRANALVPPGALREIAPLGDAAAELLRRHIERGALSARGVDRVRRVARTLADLWGRPDGPVDRDCVAMALHLRAPDDRMRGGAR